MRRLTPINIWAAETMRELRKADAYWPPQFPKGEENDQTIHGAGVTDGSDACGGSPDSLQGAKRRTRRSKPKLDTLPKS